MHAIIRKIVSLTAISVAAISSAHASYFTFNTTFTNFTALNGSAIPFSSVSLSTTYELGTTNLVAVQSNTPGFLTALNASNAAAGVTVFPGNGLVSVVTGGTLNGIDTVVQGTDDFVTFVDPMTIQLFDFSYSIAGINDIFSTTTVSDYTLSFSDNLNNVPEPGTLALGAIAGILCLMVRRKHLA